MILGVQKQARFWIWGMALMCLLAFSQPAHAAIDKRLKLVFKTAGYGAAAGLVIGAGTMVMGMGNYRNMLMGASAGLYAGILLGAYIIVTANEPEPGARRNMNLPQKPVGPNDWEEVSPEDLPPENKPPSDGTFLPKLPERNELWAGARASAQVVVWTPVMSLEF